MIEQNIRIANADKGALQIKKIQNMFSFILYQKCTDFAVCWDLLGKRGQLSANALLLSPESSAPCVVQLLELALASAR